MFPCTGCGLCCQNISTIAELNKFDLGDGVCKFFDKNTNNCQIYDQRPGICRVDEMYEVKYKDFFHSRRSFHIENAKVCNQLQSQYKLDIKFKVIIGD